MKKEKHLVYVVWMHEKGKYDDNVRYEFETREESIQFIKAMQGILIANEAYWEWK